jgi:alpha-mannosidase
MSLIPEWKRRVDVWRRELRNQLFRPLGAIPLEGFATLGRVPPEEAGAGEFRPMPPGTRWGAKWEYEWFRGEAVLPAEAAGKRIVARLEPGGEATVWVNGKPAGSRDEEHTELTLSRSGRPGERFRILLEAYAGHGPTPCSPGPVPPGRVTVPEPPPAQAEVKESAFGIWEEDAYQLRMDVETLLGLRNSLDPESLRVAEIDAGLRAFTLLVDFELPREAMFETVRRARERLQPLLACRNGPTQPVFFAFGHAHLDVVWLWPLRETERKVLRTLGNQIALAEEYPGYVFLHSQPALLAICKDLYPEFYEKVREAARAGRVAPDGAMWVEADTNLTGGESLIRQILHGKRFFREEFGIESEFLWLPDVFGYSGALPQILRGCGVRWFATSKLFWIYNGGDPFPHNTFTWEGIDGSEVLVHLCNDYTSALDPATVFTRWKERVQKDGISTRLLPFGWGDGGGGPTRDHLEFARRLEDLEGAPRVRLAHPVEYFKDQEARGVPDARYVGELYLQVHRGTYTSQARIKRGNRRCEVALREAEMWGVAARAFKGTAWPAEAFDGTWKDLLFHQFHDILPGSSIRRAVEESEQAFARIFEKAEAFTRSATASLGDGSRALTVFNSLSWPRKALVEIPGDWAGAADGRGKPLEVQVLDGKPLAEVPVPACGWTTVRPADAKPAAGGGGALRAESRLLENEHLRVEFDAKGEIARIFDKESKKDLAAGPCNRFRMFKDVPVLFDAWDIDRSCELQPVDLPGEATLEVAASGPIVAALRVRRKLLGSDLDQEISLRRGARRVEFRTVVEWRESHKLLKVEFPVRFHANEAIHEIQFGHLRRPNHRSRPFDADRFEVPQQRWTALAEERGGFAVLSDCKFGVSVLGNCIRLTLLKSALAPDMEADKGRQEFTYAFTAWNGPFADCGVVREASELTAPVRTAPGAAGEQSLLAVDAPNVMIEAVKPAEDGSPDVVVRLYESVRAATRCTLETALPVREAWEADLLEKPLRPIPCRAGKLPLEFRAFEIKTIRLKP